ncbi:MAG: hypothetical protein RLZZ281_1007 [Pseudomonadota bacterium]
MTLMAFGFATDVMAQAPNLPIIVPEAVFANLGRVTGATLQQQIMDRGSIVRVQFADPKDRLAPDTPVVLFRQGLRLRNEGKSGDRNLGILAVPVGRGRTLQALTENAEIADPNEPGVAWVRLQSVRQEISRGDSLMSERDAQRWQASACETPSEQEAPQPKPRSSTELQVIALVSSDVLADPLSTSLDLVIISGGCQAGLKTGQSLSLWRPPVTTFGRKLDQPIEARDNSSTSVLDDNPGITRTQVPGHRIGSGVIVATYAEAAIVRLRVATQPVQLGDQVRPTHIRNTP